MEFEHIFFILKFKYRSVLCHRMAGISDFNMQSAENYLRLNICVCVCVEGEGHEKRIIRN